MLGTLFASGRSLPGPFFPGTAKSLRTTLGPLTMHPTISVVIPLFNGERYVSETLDSLAAQTSEIDTMEKLLNQ